MHPDSVGSSFSRLAPILKADTRGKLRLDGRRVIDGVAHVLRPGDRWVDAPPVHGPRKTLRNRFVRWPAVSWQTASPRHLAQFTHADRAAARRERLRCCCRTTQDLSGQPCAQHPANKQTASEALFLARALSQLQCHRVHVQPLQALRSYRQQMRPPRHKSPRDGRPLSATVSFRP